MNSVTAKLEKHPKPEGCGGQHGDAKPESRNSRFPLLPADYDFSKILAVLRAKNLDLEHAESIYPCSSMQESLYMGQEMSSGTELVYQTRGLFSIPACYDAGLVCDVWNGIVRRHQSLRTTYVEASDISSDRLLDAVVLRDLPDCVVVEGTTFATVDEIRRGLAGPCSSGFARYGHLLTIYSDPGTPRLVGGRRLICKIEIPHMAVDGSSLCILLDELSQGLRSRNTGTAVARMPTATQYEEYIKYLQHRESSGDVEALEYWIDYLDGTKPCFFPTLCEPPVATSTATSASSGSSSHSIPIDVPFNDLRVFCRKNKATISNALQTVWALLLQTYAGGSDVCFGYLSSGRSVPIAGAATIVGPLMNLLVSRVTDLDDKSLGDVVAKMRSDFINALPHQTFPIHKVHSILGANETRLFNTIVTSYYAPSMLAEGDDAEVPVKLIESHNASNFQLVLKIVYSDTDILVRLAYSPSLLSAAAATKVASTFESILHKMVVAADINSEPALLDAISAQDLEQISAWNWQTLSAHLNGPLPKACVHWLVQDRARLQPSAPAICAWDGEMDYQALERASSAVAHAIHTLGIGPGAFVPLCFEKSLWYTVALLAVLKSGNAFVPLDPSNPTARAATMLHQLGIGEHSGLILCSRLQHARCAPLAQHVLTVPLDDDEPPAVSESLPCAPLSGPGLSSRPVVSLPMGCPDDAAYIIFTSGSTGEPKGVVVEHGAYAFAARAHKSGLRLEETSRVLQFASYGFDTSKQPSWVQPARNLFLAATCSDRVYFQAWRTISRP